MKILGVAVSRWNNDTEKPVILDMAEDLSSFSIFTRGGARETLRFGVRTITQRLPAGLATVEYEGYNCHCVVQPNGLSCVIIADREYPARVAFDLGRTTVREFETFHAATWRRTTEDMSLKFDPMHRAIVQYQKPEEVDKLLRVQRIADDTKDVLVRTIDQVLKRGEDLDKLLDDSKDLSDASKRFYKQAKKTNSCCVIM